MTPNESKHSDVSEITFELTNYCPHKCPYCSSDAGPDGETFLNIGAIRADLVGRRFGRINLSGGEPLAHPAFWYILQLCKHHTDDVVVYTNALRHIRYNAGVIDGVYVDANLTVLPGTAEVHVLRRIPQGREATRPEVHLSGCWANADCECDHRLIRPDGTKAMGPCRKYIEETA